MERPERIVFLCALWFIMGGQPTLYWKTCNIFNLLALLLFFKMILFSCGGLVRSSCSPLVYFESVRSGRLVFLYYMLKPSSAKCHHFWSSHILSSRPHYINAHNKITACVASFKRIAEIAQRGLQGGNIGLESLLHYKENLTCFYVFMHVRYWTLSKWIWEWAHERNIVERSTG